MKQYEYNQLDTDEKLIYLIQSSKVELIKHCFETLYLSLDDEDNIIDANVGYRNYLVDGSLPISGGNVSFGTYASLGIDLSLIGTSKFASMSSSEKLAACGITPGMTSSDVLAKGLIVETSIPEYGRWSHVKLNAAIAEDFQNIYNEVQALGKFKFIVTSSFRPGNSVNKGTSRHCYGLAVDINGGNAGNPYFNTRNLPVEGNKMPQRPPWPWDYVYKNGHPQAPYNGEYDPTKCFWYWKHPIIQIFQKHGWGWGGAYGDTMHFSIDGH